MGQALSRSFSADTSIATDTHRKSAAIVNLRKNDLPTIREQVRKMAPDVLWAAFPAPSQRQVCIQASKATGASPDTFERILNGSTAAPDILLLTYAARVYADRTGKESPLAALIGALLQP